MMEIEAWRGLPGAIKTSFLQNAADAQSAPAPRTDNGTGRLVNALPDPLYIPSTPRARFVCQGFTRGALQFWRKSLMDTPGPRCFQSGEPS